MAAFERRVAPHLCSTVLDFFVIGVIGMPPGVVYGAPVFPGHVLAPMMQPRFR